MSFSTTFARFAKATSRMSGHPGTFVVAMGVIVVWAVTGPIFHFSDTWQLVINTGTTVVTFLMVFLIQNTQNRDGAAMQIKLDELIRAVEGAHNTVVDLEDMSDEELAKVKAHYDRLAERAKARLKEGHRDTGTAESPEDEEDQAADTGNARGSGKAATKASTA